VKATTHHTKELFVCDLMEAIGSLSALRMRPYLETRLMACVLEGFSPYHSRLLMQLGLLWDVAVTLQVVIFTSIREELSKCLFEENIALYSGPAHSQMLFLMKLRRQMMVVMFPYKNCSEARLCCLSKRPTCWQCCPCSVGRSDGAKRGFGL